MLRCEVNDGQGLNNVWFQKIGNGAWSSWVNGSHWSQSECNVPRFSTCQMDENQFSLNTAYPGSDMWSQTVINRRTGALTYRSNDPKVWTGTCKPSPEPQQPRQIF